MVTLIFEDGSQQEFGEGEFSAQNGDFPNDTLAKVKVPFGWEAKVSKDFGDAGNRVGLQGALMPGETQVHDMAVIGLGRAVSWIGIQNLTGGIDIDGI